MSAVLLCFLTNKSEARQQLELSCLIYPMPPPLLGRRAASKPQYTCSKYTIVDYMGPMVYFLYNKLQSKTVNDPPRHELSLVGDPDPPAFCS